MPPHTKASWNVERRRRTNVNEGKAPCQVSGRWLQFPAKAHEFKNGTFLAVDVMTADSDGNPRKLCELVLVKEELLELLTRIPHD
ncbi:hypothetical protein SAMN05192563_1004224 [Paraburkholderia aspalathi]|uniref:Uncharacterized protein n=2 Tax=Paraburkholderia aspalathi TaxID=1324617 RepID=A0A1I7B6Q4_9BURK|nr:hypothetical protein SAMN05192563_1004224 [Paraburkholderia aspalathi]